MSNGQCLSVLSPEAIPARGVQAQGKDKYSFASLFYGRSRRIKHRSRGDRTLVTTLVKTLRAFGVVAHLTNLTL